ncbi:hypothetical protein V2A60_000457 [Cordyceps javanica]|uniref:Uncharacterized protein n=1 Tax=Cordyceps javanica TaxID=43265 RepID=A0A545W2I5_9HYPO|nr:hypothetical protein IF1G_04142 [Cordyceps javanica]TQW08164.1 hypothetical protein IF2G_04040 [Cordyceps javanica]
MASSSPPFQTPHKRKRGQETPLTPIKFTFSLSREDSVEDGASSPRTTVAHHFKGLDLQGGDGGVAGLPDSQAADVADGLPLKRQKADQPMADVSNSVDATVAVVTSGEPGPGPETVADVDQHKGTGEHGPPDLSRQRPGTPPLKLIKSPLQDSNDSDNDEGEPHIVDPVRAALTWHEDEITVYDPDDKDDDGTGINGIGFRPTPAIAHARSMKRRQQITEYRKREESEARARRNQRRREGEGPSGVGKASPRKVRFSDSELRNIAVTI